VEGGKSILIRTICKAHKENMVLVVILGLVVISLPTLLAIILRKHIYLMVLFVIMTIIFAAIFLCLIIREAITKNDIVLFNDETNEFIVNRYTKIYKFNIDDILSIKYDNKGISSLGPLIFFETETFGSLIFTLKNKKKIRTPLVDDVLEKFNEVNVLINKNN
jgi:hypothetical protein